MGTLVCFHAHPDDESIATGGTMAKAAAAGHRVVLVVATRGEHGEPVPEVLGVDEQLTLRRTAEVYTSADALGAARVEFLGYVDSGMVRTETAKAPWAFCNADVEHAAKRLALILEEERADVLTTYDDNGSYGHPDHIQVHRVGRRAAELAGVEQVFESTINRDHLMRGMRRAASEGALPEGLDAPDLESDPDFGKPESVITHCVDVTDVLDTKRASMLAHRSQMADTHFLLAMPPDLFAYGLGSEWYIAEGPPPPDGSLAAELFRPIH
jgi:LmbE family N-acetylglucosaminyl deacetylase